MGIGIVAILLLIAPFKFRGMEEIAIGLFFINCFLFALFVAINVARFTLYPWVFKRMVTHSGQSVFLGTLPMGLATIINGIVLIAVPRNLGSWAVPLAWALWWLDTGLSVLCAFSLPAVVFHKHLVTLDKFTGAWLLPIVPLVVASASGGVVATALEPAPALVTLGVSVAMWGAGMGLSFLIIGIYLLRLMLHKLPSVEVIVSSFLPLGPLGQGAFGLMKMADTTRATLAALAAASASPSEADALIRIGDTLHLLSLVGGLMLWGLGLWWLVHGVSSVTIRAISDRLSFSMGFYGFIFPLGVYTSATVLLGLLLPSPFFSYLAMVFITALVMLLLWVVAGTVRGAFNGTLFVAPCLSDVCKGMQAELQAAPSSV